MGKMKDGMQENNPLIQAYIKILPITVVSIAVIFFAVKVISGILAPNHLELQVTYKDFEQGAMIQVPMYAAEDEGFTQELKLVEKKESGFMNAFDFLNFAEEEEREAEDGTYTFRYEYRETPKAVYVTSPEWWSPVSVETPMSFPAETGAESGDLDGFGAVKVTNVEVVKISTGIFNINVTMTSAGDAVPTDVKLKMDEYVFDEWDGSTEPVYDPAAGFGERTLVFRYNREALEDISHLMEDASLEIHEYTVHREYKDVQITSSLEGLEIIPCGK